MNHASYDRIGRGLVTPTERLPHVDEHSVEIAADPEAAWEALLGVLERSFGSHRTGQVARLLRCADTETTGPRPLTVGSTFPGFHVELAKWPEELALTGSHCFSDYALIFRLEELGERRTQLRAETRATFPGLSGRAYRAMVIGTRGHVLVTRRLLGAAKRRAEPRVHPGDPQAEPRYVHAAGLSGMTRFYDSVIALTMRERLFRGRLAAEVLEGLPENGRIADVGAGTGTFAIALAAAAPAAEVVGVDGDPEVLAIARAKEGAGAVEWKSGLANELPLADQSCDRVAMSLLLHHLDADGKRSALAEAHRVLRDGGRLHIADWGRPQDPLMRAGLFTLALIDGFDGIRDHAAGRLPLFIESAGFSPVKRHDRLRTAWGTLELLSAVRR